LLRALARAVRQRLGAAFLDGLQVNGFVPVACDGTRLECPRSAPLQARLGQASRPGAPPFVYLTTLVLLPLGLPWSWRWGRGTASELEHLRQLLPTLPDQALLVADAYYLGYDLYRALLRAGASFLVRMSSRAHRYTLQERPLERFRQGQVYFWPQQAQKAGQPPLRLRLLRVGGHKAPVWLLTNVLGRERLSRKTAGQMYRWRWRNAGLFRHYKRLLKKVKLSSRTVPLVHREGEGSRLALQLLLALAAQRYGRGRHAELVGDSPRQVLLRIRGDMMAWLRRLGPRQWAQYQRRLRVVRAGPRARGAPKLRQRWPCKGKRYQPPGPPQLRVLPDHLKAKFRKRLRAA
jgi:hypothetical protein